MSEDSEQPEPSDGDIAVAGALPPAPAAVAESGTPPSASDIALARYRARMRRSRARYYALVGVVVAALLAWVLVAWSRGEAAHASLHTFPAPPPTLSVRTPSTTQTVAWQTSDRIALGVPQYGGTLVTYSTHTVGGRNVRTGAQTWKYTRTDRVVCTAAQLSGTTIALYANHGNCDEMSAFASDTGQRRWTRTLDMDGMPFDGQASYQVTPFTFLAASPSVIYAIDPISGENRWTYYRFGCQIEHVVLGNDGALISQNCSPQVRCKGVKFCGRGPQLLLRDPSAGRADNKPNADQIKWNRLGDTSVPASADQVISSVGPHGRALFVHDQSTGARTHRVELVAPASPNGAVAATATDLAELIWVGGVIYALPPDSSTALWDLVSSAAPVVVSTQADNQLALATARITVPTSAGIGVIDGNDGTVADELPVSSASTAAAVYSAGAGFLVVSQSGIIAYR